MLDRQKHPATPGFRNARRIVDYARRALGKCRLGAQRRRRPLLNIVARTSARAGHRSKPGLRHGRRRIQNPLRDIPPVITSFYPRGAETALKSICQGGRGIATIVRSIEPRFLGIATAVKMTISDEFGRSSAEKGDYDQAVFRRYPADPFRGSRFRQPTRLSILR